MCVVICTSCEYDRRSSYIFTWKNKYPIIQLLINILCLSRNLRSFLCILYSFGVFTKLVENWHIYIYTMTNLVNVFLPQLSRLFLLITYSKNKYCISRPRSGQYRHYDVYPRAILREMLALTKSSVRRWKPATRSKTYSMRVDFWPFFVITKFYFLFSSPTFSYFKVLNHNDLLAYRLTLQCVTHLMYYINFAFLYYLICCFLS